MSSLSEKRSIAGKKGANAKWKGHQIGILPAWIRYRDSYRQSAYAWRTRTKKAIHVLLGGKCKRCGFDDDDRALQIDHINGGGNAEIKNMKGNYQKVVLQSILNSENKYQLLCANCNWIKRFERNEVKKTDKRSKRIQGNHE